MLLNVRHTNATYSWLKVGKILGCSYHQMWTKRELTGSIWISIGKVQSDSVIIWTMLQAASCWVARWHLEAWHFLQKCQEGWLWREDSAEPLHLALAWQHHSVHVQVSNHINTMQNTLTIDQTQSCFVSCRYALELTCPMSFEKYPHDKQTCAMSLESCKLLELYLNCNVILTLKCYCIVWFSVLHYRWHGL